MKRRGVPDVVLMSSSGGDLTEAMLVGRLFRGLFVVVLPNVSSPEMPSECNSACAAIVLSSRTYASSSDVIGLHRPYFDANLYAELSISDARRNYERLEKEFREYLLEMGVKQHLIDRIMSKSSKEAWYVSLGDFIKENGQPPYIQEWLLARCPGSESNNPECISEATSVARLSYLKGMPGLKGIQ